MDATFPHSGDRNGRDEAEKKCCLLYEQTEEVGPLGAKTPSLRCAPPHRAEADAFDIIRCCEAEEPNLTEIALLGIVSSWKGNTVTSETSNPISERGAVEAEIVVTDALLQVVARKPVEFQATVDALTPYLVEQGDGLFSITVPDEVVKTVDRDSYTAILNSFDRAKQDMQGYALSPDEAEVQVSIPKIPWSAIFKLVKSRGQWVWYKVGNCTAAVVRNWGDISNDPNPKNWILPAAIACGNAMRK